MSEAAAFAVESAPSRTLPGLRPMPSALRPRRLCLALAILVLCGSAFATLTGPVVAVFIGPVDKVLVDKSAKKLWLMRDGKRLYGVEVSLGKNPKGQKQREGDQRTPEGRYRLDWRDAGTDYHRAILVSYPSQADRARGVLRNHGFSIARRSPCRSTQKTVAVQD